MTLERLGIENIPPNNCLKKTRLTPSDSTTKRNMVGEGQRDFISTPSKMPRGVFSINNFLWKVNGKFSIFNKIASPPPTSIFFLNVYLTKAFVEKLSQEATELLLTLAHEVAAHFSTTALEAHLRHHTLAGELRCALRAHLSVTL